MVRRVRSPLARRENSTRREGRATATGAMLPALLGGLPMSKLDQNIRLARRCISDLNGLNIKSNNVPFRRGTYFKCSKYHSFVMSATRCETVGIPDQVLDRRRQVLSLLADHTKTKEQKRAAVKALMVQWGPLYFRKHAGR